MLAAKILSTPEHTNKNKEVSKHDDLSTANGIPAVKEPGRDGDKAVPAIPGDTTSPKKSKDKKDPYRYRPKSTWQNKSWRQRTFFENLCSLDICPESVYTIKDKSELPAQVPYHSVALENAFILSGALYPIALQYIWYTYMGTTWHPAVAFFIYHLSFVGFAMTMLKRLHFYMVKYGVFDQENRPRDKPSDRDVNRLGFSIFIYTILRTAGALFLQFDRNVTPTITWWWPVRTGLWMLALDYLFYVYHRSCHQIGWLWFIHKGHHATGHPTPVMSILADDIQEVLEIVLIPLGASLIVPMPFHDLYISICYLLYVEALGHSGIRADWPHPILGHLLRPFGMDLAVEDHDLHHRFGRSGMNYGKQTRVYDKIFDSITERIDTERT